MKKLTFVIMTISLCTSCKQNPCSIREVPVHIQQKFNYLYPGHFEHVKWEKADSQYKAKIKLSKHNVTLQFAENGDLLQTQTQIPFKLLPETILRHLDSQYADYKVSKSLIIRENDSSFYELDLKNKSEKLDLTYSTKGKLVKMATELISGTDE